MNNIIKLNTGKDGLEAIWKQYEIETITELIEHGERTSGQVYKGINLRVEISRTSVIFFLNRLVDSGLASFYTRTGKGGHHKVYSLLAESWDKFNDTVIESLLLKLWEIFPTSERIKSVIST